MRGVVLVMALVCSAAATGLLEKKEKETELQTAEERANLLWTAGEFSFPCPSTRSIYVSSGRYIKKNVIATRLQVGSLGDQGNGMLSWKSTKL